MAKLLCVLSALMVLSIGFVGVASACSRAGANLFPADGQWRQDEPSAAATFPEPVMLNVIDVYRNTDSPDNSSCLPAGHLKIGVSPDNITDYGLRWTIVDGTSPPNFISLKHPTQANEPLQMLWEESKDRLKESYEFQITATWVDAWGREGNTSEPLLIYVPTGEEFSGSSCSHVAGGSSPVENGLVWMGLGVMVLVVRRKVF